MVNALLAAGVDKEAKDAVRRVWVGRGAEDTIYFSLFAEYCPVDPKSARTV